jgi:multidrug resistance efflux pump
MNSSRPLSWAEFRQRFMPFAVFALVLVATALLWNKHTGRSTIVGQAEAVRTLVSAGKPGTLIALKTDLLQRVKRGDVVAQIIPADLEAVCAELNSKVETLRAELQQTTDRNLVNYQGLRLDLLRRNVELASANVERQLAESEYQRYFALHQNHSVSDAEFETRRSNRDALQSKVDSLTHLAADLEKQITSLQPANSTDENPAIRAVTAAVVAQQKQLEALSEAANLKAPMDGVVSTISKRPGEIVKPGDPVLTIGALRPARIVAYVRQPFDGRVKPGDVVQVSTRGSERVTASARVLEVGTQLEAIDPTLLPAGNFSSSHVIEYGLPLLVEMPANFSVAPGEVVNVAALAMN